MSKTPDEASASKLLTPQELAERWSIPVGRLSEWRYSGIGPPYVKIGRYPRYRVEDIAQYEARHRQVPSVTAELVR